MFDFCVPASWAAIPGRIHVCRDDPVMAKKTHAERMEQMRQYAAKRRAINAPKPIKRREVVEPMDDATYWATNRERIAKRRKELAAQKRNPQRQLRASNQ